MSDQEQNKSERATPFKLSKAREKGTVARGVDLGFLTTLAAFMVFVWVEGPIVKSRLGEGARRALIAAPNVLNSPYAILTTTGEILSFAVYALAWMPVIVFAAVFTFEMIQTGPVFTTEPLRPDFSRLNPANGLKRIFSLRLLIETGKNILKMAGYGAITALVIRFAYISVAPTVTDAASLAAAMTQVGQRLLTFFVVAAAAFAIIDQLIVRGDFQKRMRMTRRDVRRELRDREGDPRMRQRRKQLHRQFVKLSKSVRNIRDADVLITNPIHYAVALKYDASTMLAPTIVSQAMNHYAQRLRRLAFIYGVTVVQNEALARALYHRGEFEKQIPELYFRSVAEIYISIRDKSAKSKGQDGHV